MGVIVSIIQRLQTLCSLPTRQFVRICCLEEPGRQLHKPFGIYGAHLPHVLLAGQHQLKVDHPIRLTLKQRRGRVNENRVLLHNCLVAFLWVFACSMKEEPRADSLADLVIVTPTCDKVQLVAVHNLQQLLAYILRSLQAATLNEVFMAPGVAELAVLPAIIDSQQGEVVALWLEELGLLLVSLSLLLSRPIEDVLQVCNPYLTATSCSQKQCLQHQTTDFFHNIVRNNLVLRSRLNLCYVMLQSMSGPW